MSQSFLYCIFWGLYREFVVKRIIELIDVNIFLINYIYAWSKGIKEINEIFRKACLQTHLLGKKQIFGQVL
jgi:hypothetical protein